MHAFLLPRNFLIGVLKMYVFAYWLLGMYPTRYQDSTLTQRQYYVIHDGNVTLGSHTIIPLDSLCTIRSGHLNNTHLHHLLTFKVAPQHHVYPRLSLSAQCCFPWPHFRRVPRNLSPSLSSPRPLPQYTRSLHRPLHQVVDSVSSVQRRL
jgi:hypothetical protein